MIASPTTLAPSVRSEGVCLFHDGIATLDLLLAEIDPRERLLFDAALDLRSLASGNDAEACVAQLFGLRALLDGRHYLAFYRVRCWARRTFRIEVQHHRGGPVIARELPLDCARLDEAVNASLAYFARDGVLPEFARVRFVFSPR